MPNCRPARRRSVVFLGLALLQCFALGLVSMRHLALKRSEPASGSRLASPPTRIWLWFTERPELAMSRLKVTGPSGAVALEPPVADTGFSVRSSLRQTLPPGAYRVEWKSASSDGHPIRGEFSFSVQPPNSAIATSDTQRVSAATDIAQRATRDESGSRTARWLEFIALLTVLGVLGFRHGVLPPLAVRGVSTADAADSARRLGQSVLTLYAIAALVRLYMQSSAVYGRDAALNPDAVLTLIGRTTWGLGWIAGVIGAVTLVIGWRISKTSVTIGTPLALTGAFAMVLSPALSGHAAASRHFVWSVTLDTLHVAAAGVWIGGLLIVLIAGIPAMLRLEGGNQHAAVSALVNSFHPIALFCAPLAVVAGLGMSWIRLGSVQALWGTLYGQTLLIKLGLVMALAGLGAYNSLRARRRLGLPDGVATARFRMSAAVEVALGAAVVAATTFLVVTPVPSELAP
jgi:copper transport protein